MDSGDVEQEARRLMAEGDLVALFPLVDRRMDMETKKAVRAYVTKALEEAKPQTLATLFVPKRARLDQLFGPIAARLTDEKTREEMTSIVRRLIAEGARGNEELRAILARTGLLELEELRACARLGDRDGGSYRLRRAAIFALVKRDDGAWLEAWVADERVGGADLGSLFNAAEQDNAMAKRLVRLASDGDDTEVLALTCKYFDVGRPLVEKAVTSKAPQARRYAMRHVHRLRDPRAALAEALTDPDTGVRRAALAFLVERPDARLREYVEALVDDPDPYDERYNTEPVSFLARRFLKLLGPP